MAKFHCKKDGCDIYVSMLEFSAEYDRRNPNVKPSKALVPAITVCNEGFDPELLQVFSECDFSEEFA